MKYFKIYIGIITLSFVGACSESNCIKCISEDVMLEDVEVCDDSEVTYTDLNGEDVEFTNLKEYFESLGYSCD